METLRNCPLKTISGNDKIPDRKTFEKIQKCYHSNFDYVDPFIDAYIDNFVNNGSIEAENEIVLKKDMLKNSIRILTFYQILPCIWKSKAPVDEIDFYHCINIAHFQPFSDYWS